MASITDLENYDSDQHFTPKSIFDALNCTFDLDVAASHLSSNVPSYNKFTIQNDALSQVWNGFIWMNPPYSKPAPWVDRFIEHDNGIALLPVTRGKWWDKVWDSDCLIIPNVYNFKFERPNGEKRDIMFRTMIIALGEKGKEILKQSNLGKVR